MMSAREVVAKAVDFGGPEWTPYHISVSTRQLASQYTPSQIGAMEKALLDLGVARVDNQLVAQTIFSRASPSPTELPEPYRPLQGDEWVDEWGTIWTCTDYPRVSGHPLETSWDLLDTYSLPDPRASGRYEQAKDELARYPDRYRLGSVWFTLFERLWMLRGFNNALMDPYLYPDRFVQLRDSIIEFNLASIREQLGLGVDGIYFSDDWGTQRTLLINPDDWRKWYKPQYKRMFDAVHAGGAHVWMHLCGNVTSIIPDLIEIGLNVLNPIQPQAMDVNALADEFGGRLCFFGGVDVQGTLPHGTTLDVEREARHLINIFARYSGGYIGSTSHTILLDTPLENIVALFRTFREYSGA